MIKINQLHAIRVFLRVADSNSFGGAAASLGVSNAVVSRYIALLEAHLQTRLVNRTTHHVALTDAGKAYAAGCRAVVAQIDALEAQVSATAQRAAGRLRLVATTDFPPGDLSALLAAFRARYPGITLDVTLTQRQVDLVEEGFDAGLVTPRMVRSGTLVCRPLLDVPLVLVGAPAYLDARPALSSPAALADAPVLAPATHAGGAEWVFDGAAGAGDGDGAGSVVSAAVTPVMTANHALLLAQAAVDGFGLALVPVRIAAPHLASGALRRVLPDWRLRCPDGAIAVAYPGRRHVPAKTRGFVDFAVGYCRDSVHAPTNAGRAYSGSGASGLAHCLVAPC